ncbi:MAG: TAXI family TRAP transporter solute-binding subunit [Candidatus Latescibacteria bacterium]|nr:TAXI family TRAP transporter solute-binding subunit [Candidatus Latescibacterota bacterium]
MTKSNLLKGVCLLLAVVLGVGIYQSAQIEYPPSIRIGGGAPGGRYDALNKALQARLDTILQRRFGTSYQLVHTQGSVDNLRRLQKGELDLAFFQEGVGGGRDLRSLVNLEYEYVLLVTRSNETLDDLSDLHQRRINVGPQGSGTLQVVEKILAYYPLSAFQPRHFSVGEVVSSFASELDGAFFVSGLQAPLLVELLKDPQYQLVGLDFAPAMATRHNWVVPRMVPRATFARQPQAQPPIDLATLAVRSSLVARQQVPAPLVEALVEGGLGAPYIQENNLGQLHDWQQSGFAHARPPFPLHPGAKAVFFPWEPKIPSDFVESWNGIIGLLVLLGSGVYTGISQWRQRGERLRQEQALAQKNALDEYVRQLEELCTQVVGTTDEASLDKLRRNLNLINLQASRDYRDEKFRSSDDFTAFTAQASYVLAQIVAKMKYQAD